MKLLKTFLVSAIMAVIAISFAACGTAPSGNEGNLSGGGSQTDGTGNKDDTSGSGEGNGDNTSDENKGDGDTAGGEESNTLVVYFSCTDTTKKVAEFIQAELDCDIYRIVHETPYTSADLNYGN